MNAPIVDRNPFIPTLRTLALRVCVNYANNIASLGDLPFILVAPILHACTAAQLALLEDQSPHLRLDTQEIWHRHVSDRFKRHFEIEEGEDWRDVHERLMRDESQRLKEATARLRAKNGRLKEEKLAKRIVVIDPKKAPIASRKRPNPFGGGMLPAKRGDIDSSERGLTKEEELVDGESQTGHLHCEVELRCCAKVLNR